MAVKVLARTVVTQVVRGLACRAAMCTSRRSTPASSMVVTYVSQHVGVHPRQSDDRDLRESP